VQHQHAGPSCIQDFIGGAGWTKQRVSEWLSRLKTGVVQQKQSATSQDQNQAENQTTIQPILDEGTERPGVSEVEEDTSVATANATYLQSFIGEHQGVLVSSVSTKTEQPAKKVTEAREDGLPIDGFERTFLSLEKRISAPLDYDQKKRVMVWLERLMTKLRS